jgi:endonuclease/exonuclease/phosphatase family metal-dependent hydrolase
MIAEPKQASLRLLTYNVHKGLRPLSKKTIQHQISELIHGYSPDIICLQEVWRRDEFTESDLEQFCDGIWTHKSYGQNALFPTGSQGNAILSKTPISQWENHDISVYGKEPRGILEAKIILDLMPVHIFCVHFGLNHSERIKQMGSLSQLLAQVPEGSEVIVAGDFNDWTGSLDRHFRELELTEAYRSIHKRLPRTFPSSFPILSLDRLYSRNLIATKVIRPRVRALSDHLPYLAEFCLTPSSHKNPMRDS